MPIGFLDLSSKHIAHNERPCWVIRRYLCGTKLERVYQHLEHRVGSLQRSRTSRWDMQIHCVVALTMLKHLWSLLDKNKLWTTWNWHLISNTSTRTRWHIRVWAHIYSLLSINTPHPLVENTFYAADWLLQLHIVRLTRLLCVATFRNASLLHNCFRGRCNECWSNRLDLSTLHVHVHIHTYIHPDLCSHTSYYNIARGRFLFYGRWDVLCACVRVRNQCQRNRDRDSMRWLAQTFILYRYYKQASIPASHCYVSRILFYPSSLIFWYMKNAPVCLFLYSPKPLGTRCEPVLTRYL